VRPLLTPIGLDPAHPFPQVVNKSLNFIVSLSGKDAFGRGTAIAIVKAPRVLPRVIRLPDELSTERARLLLPAVVVIHAHISDLFTGREVLSYSQFRVTRDSDLWVDEEEVKNLRQALQSELQGRQFGFAVRLEVARTARPSCRIPARPVLRTQPAVRGRRPGQHGAPAEIMDHASTTRSCASRRSFPASR
jgi:polyphosphate kinase